MLDGVQICFNITVDDNDGDDDDDDDYNGNGNGGRGCRLSDAEVINGIEECKKMCFRV